MTVAPEASRALGECVRFLASCVLSEDQRHRLDAVNERDPLEIALTRHV